jgi:ATP-dependent Lhr-like helicase
LRAFFLERWPEADASPWERLHLDFVRGVASIELIREHFLEPINVDRTHGSTLVQQTLSILAETGGTSAADLYTRLQQSGAFGGLDAQAFALVLRTLGRTQLIEQMAEGDLILSTKSQKMIEHYSFYAAFKTPEEMAVFHRSERIGALPSDAIPGLGEHVILAGKRWVVVQINIDRKEISVERARGRHPPAFRSALLDVHPAVHLKMRALLTGGDVPTYLDETAIEILSAARSEAARLGQFEPRIQPGGDGAVFFLWAGKRISRTIYLALRARDLDVHDEDVGLDVKSSPIDLVEALRTIARDPPQEIRLAERAEIDLAARVADGEKYDWCVPDEIWRAAYARERLDVKGALSLIGDALSAY